MAPTPPSRFNDSATLVGILSRLRAGEGGEDPALRARIDAAFGKHHAKLLAFVRRELRGFSEQQVEDTVQEVLTIAWRKLPGHDGKAFRAWLFGIAAHECLNVRRKKRDALPGEDALFDVADPMESAYGRLRREERESLLRAAAARALAKQDQEVVYMRYELALPREEIARLAGLTGPDEVRVILQRSKRALAREVEAALRARGHGESLLAPTSDER